MPHAGRVGDSAQCSHHELEATSEAAFGSPDVIINNRAALRVGDAGAGAWQASAGSRGVFINGKPAVRHGDETDHEGQKGELVEGSPDVFLGDGPPGEPRERPHDRSVTLDVTDAIGRPIHDVVVSVSCPHEERDDQHVDGSAVISGLCSGAMVTVHKPLQLGTWDENASPRSGQMKHGFHAVIDAGDAPHGGDAMPMKKKKAIVHAPASSGTSPKKHTVHLAKANGGTEVVLPTVHNWVELIYRAFGHHLPTSPGQLALLGVREASLAAAPPPAPMPGEPAPPPEPPMSVDELELEARQGDLDEVVFTREHKAPTYNDLLFCVWTDKNVHTAQHVEVFECTIDAHPGRGPLRLPFLLEGQVFHAKPGPFKKHYPGKHVTLHVFHGMKERHEPKGATAEHVIAVAMKERGTTESPANSNLQKYGAWYGNNGAFWCAQFVSWVFTKAGMPEIHYQGCEAGAGMFQNGTWGTWHGGPESRAKPGDIVFFNFPYEQIYDHTGIVVKDHGSEITTIEGNTSPPGGSGSQSNGGGVYLKSRPKDGTIIGFGRPKFRDPEPPERSFIRWGGEGSRLHGKSMVGSTLLHHHYFKADHHGHMHPDPAAKRYMRFMHIYNHARNAAHIPYLIVSSRYTKTYSEWVAHVNAHPGHEPGPRSVILTSGLHSPHGHAHHYVPSFIGQHYAERVFEHIAHMHDRHKAAKLRKALEGCLLKLSI